jgi:pSer/pThr/pTyr-binding forkhead associated (FHA) protein
VIVAIERHTRGNALLLSNEDGWSVEVSPGDDLVLGRGDDTAAPIPHVATDRRHARVRYEGTTCTVEDLGSTSGTYLNGELVRKPTELADGDQLRIGPFTVTVKVTRTRRS